MEMCLDKTKGSNLYLKSLIEKTDKDCFDLKQQNNKFKKSIRIPSEEKESEALKLYGFIKEIYKEVHNGKEPRIKIKNHFPFGTSHLILLSSIGAISVIFQMYEGIAAVATIPLIFYFIQGNIIVWYDIVGREFLIYSPALISNLNEMKNSSTKENVKKNGFMYAVAVHEVSHSIKTIKLTPKDSESAEGVVKEIILNNEELLKFKPNNFIERVEHYLFLKPHMKEEFDKYVRMDIAWVVYELFKRPDSKFFNYFGEETDKLLYKLGAYIAKANPKDLIKSFKDIKEIIKTIKSLEAKQKE